MGFLDDLFGSDDPEVEKGILETRPVPVRKATWQALGQIQGLPGGNRTYPGQLNAPRSKAQQRSDILLEQLYNQLYKGGVGEASMGAWKELLSGDVAPWEEYYQKTIYDPMMEQFREDTLPGISRTYAPSGFWSSQRVQADQRAQEELIESLARERARTGYDAYQAAQDRRLEALGVTPGTVTATGMMAQEGRAATQFEQERLDRQYAEFQRRRQEQLAKVDAYIRYLGGTPQVQSYAVGMPGSTSVLGDILGGAAGAATAWGLGKLG